jgi:very-short-patch-repair endonuclease
MKPYYVDFYLFEKNIVIEVDGVYWHKDKDYDSNRDVYLESNYGVKVYRFSCKDLRRDGPKIINKILLL